jgi:hypothetical protein
MPLVKGWKERRSPLLIFPERCSWYQRNCNGMKKPLFDFLTNVGPFIISFKKKQMSLEKCHWTWNERGTSRLIFPGRRRWYKNGWIIFKRRGQQRTNKHQTTQACVIPNQSLAQQQILVRFSAAKSAGKPVSNRMEIYFAYTKTEDLQRPERLLKLAFIVIYCNG